jgi:hypothetical protein
MTGHDAVNRTAAPSDDHDAAGDEPFRDGGLHPIVDRAKSLGWHVRDRIRHRTARAKPASGGVPKPARVDR